MALVLHLRAQELQPSQEWARARSTCSRRIDLPLAMDAWPRRGTADADDVMPTVHFSLTYSAHGMSRIVYDTPDPQRVVKLAEHAEQVQANEREVEVSGALRELAPAVLFCGAAALHGPSGGVRRMHFLMVNSAIPLDRHVRLLRDDSQGKRRVFLLAVRSFAQAAGRGVLISDLKLENLAWDSDGERVLFLDAGNFRLTDTRSFPRKRQLHRFLAAAETCLDCQTRLELHNLLSYGGDPDMVARRVADALRRGCRVGSAPAHENPWAPPSLPAADEDLRDEAAVLRVATGWYVDSLTVACRGRSSRVGGEGGARFVEERLFRGELITSLEAYRLPNGSYGADVLASKLVVGTNRRQLVYEGEHRSKSSKLNICRAQAMASKCVVGVEWENGFLQFLYDDDDSDVSMAAEGGEPLDAAAWDRVIISDSTLGFYEEENRAIGLADRVYADRRALLLSMSGSSFSGTPALREHLVRRLKGFHATRVLYVPMGNSVPNKQQRSYGAHERAQSEAFTPQAAFVRLPAIMDLENEYRLAYWSRYEDSCSQLYAAKRKLHLRPKAAQFVRDWFLMHAEAGDVIWIMGWNAANPVAEFAAQRDFSQMLLQ